eukprot:1010204-Amphidinium_carterae.1
MSPPREPPTWIAWLGWILSGCWRALGHGCTRRPVQPGARLSSYWWRRRPSRPFWCRDIHVR